MSTPLDAYRGTDGTFQAYAWPGGYQVVYYTRDGSIVCVDCANKPDYEPDDDQAVVAGDIYYEGPTIQCGDCGTDIESEYGDPDATEEKETT